MSQWSALLRVQRGELGSVSRLRRPSGISARCLLIQTFAKSARYTVHGILHEETVNLDRHGAMQHT